jgi:hypothetical protein
MSKMRIEAEDTPHDYLILRGRCRQFDEFALFEKGKTLRWYFLIGGSRAEASPRGYGGS